MRPWRFPPLIEHHDFVGLPRGIAPFFRLFLSMLALTLLNGYEFYNDDVIRYVGNSPGSPVFAPISLTLFNHLIYPIGGTWGTIIIQQILFAYILARFFYMFDIEPSFLLCFAVILFTDFFIYSGAILSDGWTPMLIILIYLINRSASAERSMYILYPLLFFAASVHNVHVVIGICSGLLALLIFRNMTKFMIVILLIMLTVPYNAGLIAIFSPGTTSRIQFGFVADHYLMTSARMHHEFCLTAPANPFCRSPCLEEIDSAQNEEKRGRRSTIWGSHSILLDTASDPAQGLSIEEYESASRQFVFFLARHPLAVVDSTIEQFSRLPRLDLVTEFSENPIRKEFIENAAVFQNEVSFIEHTYSWQAYNTVPFIKYSILVSPFIVIVLSVLVMIRSFWIRDRDQFRVVTYLSSAFLVSTLFYCALVPNFARYFDKNIILLGLGLIIGCRTLLAPTPPARQSTETPPQIVSR